LVKVHIIYLYLYNFSAAEEILTETMIVILNYHCNKSKTYHKELKICLRSAISKYSHNMQFLFSMLWNEVNKNIVSIRYRFL
jgi:hypothetical protein